MKRVLITGANSYIGESFKQYANSYYADMLQIDTLDMLSESWRESDFEKYDTVFHVAGIAHADVGNVSEETKALYYSVNTDLAVETARKAQTEGVQQFIFMSSMIVYGGMEHVTAETEPKPANFYGDSKWQADKAIRELETPEFKVAVLRPPMIYGKGSKGNYPILAKLAKKLPVFPMVSNKRSMLYIENLCEFLCLIIKNESCGIFFPQNNDLVNTSDLVGKIAKECDHKIWITGVLNPFVAIGKCVPGKIGSLCKKAFGSSYYDLNMSDYIEPYCICDLEQSVKKTEG